MASAFEAVRRSFERAAEGLGLERSLREALAAPTREITVQLRVPMDDGGFRVFEGYRVQHNDARGPYKGGIRFHPDVSLDEVRTFAALMTWKTSLMEIPFGGGKGGVRVDPKPLSEAELERLSRAYLRAIADAIGPHVDIPAPDVNTNARIMGWMVDEYSRTRGHSPAVITGKPVVLGGSLGRESATGRGSAICLERLVRARGWVREETPVTVEGFGNAGSWLAMDLEDLGYPVVAVSDSRGGIFADGGLPTREVVAHKERTGSVVGFEGAETIAGDDLVGLDCVVLALAALEARVDGSNAERIKAQVILETANHPVTPEADPVLEERGRTVLPDILASGGGVAVSYLEWAQNLQRERWSEDDVNGRLRTIMSAATDQVLARADEEALSPREAAYLIAVDRVAEAERARSYR